MKMLKTYDDRCIGCFTCVTTCSRTFFKEDDPAKSCIEVFPVEGTGDFRLSFCNQCGTCVDVCPTDALSINKQGVVMINKKLCSGCYVCVGICPTGNMRTHPDLEIPFKCTVCGACARECPADALEVVTE